MDEKHKEMKQVGPGPETRRPEGRSMIGRREVEAKGAHGRGLLSCTVDPDRAGPFGSHERDHDRCLLPSPWQTTSGGHVEDASPLVQSVSRVPIPTLFQLPYCLHQHSCIPGQVIVSSRARGHGGRGWAFGGDGGEGGLLTGEGSTVIPDRFIIEDRVRWWYSGRRFDCGP